MGKDPVAQTSDILYASIIALMVALLWATSYTKRIDVWVIGAWICFLSACLIILLRHIMHHGETDEKDEVIQAYDAIYLDCFFNWITVAMLLLFAHVIM